MEGCKHRVEYEGRCYWYNDGLCVNSKQKGGECRYEAKPLFPKPKSQEEQLDRVLRKLGY